MFLLKEYIVFAVTPSLTRIVFRFFSQVIVLLLLQELKHGKLSSKFALTLLIDVNLHSKNPLCYIVLYVHEKLLLDQHNVFSLLFYL